MKMFASITLIVTLFFIPAGQVRAFYVGYCSEPSEPYCADSFGEFSDQYDYNNCRSEVENFIDESNNAIECMNNEIEERLNKIRTLQSEIEDIRVKQREIKEKAEEVIDNFNRKVQRSSY